MEQLVKIAHFVLDSFIHIWPYLLITIPLAVAVQLSGAARYINKALTKKPLISIILATLVGAFSPFCSCGVIPVIASLLIGGVPLAPVMSFWIASPSMDPEIFFLSTASIGLQLSAWRLVATCVISLSAGFITHFAYSRGYLGKDILRGSQPSSVIKPWKYIGQSMSQIFSPVFLFRKPQKKVKAQLIRVTDYKKQVNQSCCVTDTPVTYRLNPVSQESKETFTICGSGKNVTPSYREKLVKETWKAAFMVIKFMALAFFINALINFYVPRDFVSSLLGGTGSFSVVTATLIGIPAYTTNITALPLISGLMALGMNKGAALAFLIAGPTTTLPAMMAVWGLVKKRIFLLYLSFSLVGALVFGLLYNLIN